MYARRVSVFVQPSVRPSSMNTTAEAERMRRPACSRPQPGSEDTWLQVRHEPLNNFFQEIKSPRFPEPYPAAFECQWSFTVPAHHRYKLVTTHAEFEYSADPDCHDNHSDTSHVEVVSVGREPLRLKKYCGNRIRRTHVITGDYHKSPTVHVCFRSSGQPAQRAKGFRAVFFTYPKHGLIAFNTERSDAALLKQSELSHCAKPRCVRNYGPQDERTKFYYDAGAIKSLLKSTLKDANESALNGTHACRHHPIHQMLVDGARTNSGDFLWQSFHGRDGTRNPCAGGHRTRRRAARTP
eukprot:scpid68857/ scgid31390/ 